MKTNIIPRIAAIHDLSGFGRCSLSVIIPTLSAMGMQVCSLPTAVLSTHTGGFDGYTFVDLTDTMDAYAAHWKSLGISFDCIYSGFLGSQRQIDIILSFIDTFQTENKLVVVDPVFADNGKLYSTFTPDFVPHMRRLVRARAGNYAQYYGGFVSARQKVKGQLQRARKAKDWLLALSKLGPQTRRHHESANGGHKKLCRGIQRCRRTFLEGVVRLCSG